MKDLKFYIKKALENNFALGAVNFSNMECLQGIANACKKLSSPMIIAVSEGAFKYMGENFVVAMSNAIKKDYPYLFLHLDHGKSIEICKKAVDLGFDSVMIDGSSLDFKDNITLTKEVVKYAHSKNVLVEGELGQIKGIEDNVSSEYHYYTNPDNALVFVEQTKVDLLAISIGTSHGAYKYNGNQTLRIDILQEIENKLPNFPLVLHGASQVNQNLILKINEYGGNIKGATGVPCELLQEVVKKHNVVKINTDTDIRLAMTAAIRETLTTNTNIIDPRTYLGNGVKEIEKVVMDKIISVFHSENQI